MESWANGEKQIKLHCITGLHNIYKFIVTDLSLHTKCIWKRTAWTTVNVS